MSKSRSKEEFVPGTLSTLARGLRILEYVVQSPKLVRLRDVAEEFSLDRSAALRFLKTLEAERFVSRYDSMKAYSIGPKLHSLPRLAPVVQEIIDKMRPALVQLAQDSGQFTHMGILNDTHAVLVEVVVSDSPVSIRQAVGDLEPLYTSAVGKVLYAFTPEPERLELGRRIVFEKHTDRTIGDIAALEREAETIRKLGVGFDRCEGNDQIACIGCPVLDEQGSPYASIGISLVAAHMKGSVEEQTRMIELTRSCANQVERLLFGKHREQARKAKSLSVPRSPS